MKQSRIEKILLCLTSGEVDVGWTTFLHTYSDLLRNIVRQFESDESAADDCYEYVCAKLSDDDFLRLRSFNPHGHARFSTWLTTVAGNLCKDWRRSVYGRQRPPQVVQQLPELEQLVFQYLFRQGMTHHECLHVLNSRYPKLEANDVRRISREIYELLSTDQRWQVGIRRNRTVSVEEVDLFSVDYLEPEVDLQRQEERKRLEKALSRLDPFQRLLVLLRYQQDLTLNEVARLTGLEDPFKARREIEKAVATLQKYFDL